MMNTGIGWYMESTVRLVVDEGDGPQILKELVDDDDGRARDVLGRWVDFYASTMELCAYIEESERRAPIAE